MDAHAGLLAFVPETAVWTEDAQGVASAASWSDEDVRALQLRLQPILTAIADRKDSVALTLYPVRLTWERYSRACGLFRRMVAPPSVMHDGLDAGVLCVQDEGLNGVELAVFYAALLLREHPNNIIRCVSPRAYHRPGFNGQGCGSTQHSVCDQ